MQFTRKQAKSAWIYSYVIHFFFDACPRIIIIYPRTYDTQLTFHFECISFLCARKQVYACSIFYYDKQTSQINKQVSF